MDKPLYVMCKPAGPMCNMACEYCYYLGKKELYTEAKRTYMTDETLEEFIRQYIEAQPGKFVQFTWHGGEATLRPLSFYKRAVELQRKYGEGKQIDNCFQTNGLLLNDEWCRFFHNNGWLVGLSIDGPQDFHDEYRHLAAGQPSHQRVMRAVNFLNRNKVEWNAMAVVNDYNADFPDEFYKFFKDIECHYIQFAPIVERLRPDSVIASVQEADAELAPFSITPKQWGDFLCRVFDLWVTRDVGEYFVQIFDATLANYVGVTPGLCTMAKHCGHATVMEYNGDVYSCDHFVFPEYKLGNIHTDSLVAMCTSERQNAFGLDKERALAQKCRDCRYLRLCNGECPKNRILPGGENYLCEGYRRFFAHAEPAMKFMADQLAKQLPPSAITQDDEMMRRYFNSLKGR